MFAHDSTELSLHLIHTRASTRKSFLTPSCGLLPASEHLPLHIGATRIPDVEERERQWRTRCKFFACDFVNRSTRVEDCTAKRSWFGSRAIQFFSFRLHHAVNFNFSFKREKKTEIFFRSFFASSIWHGWTWICNQLFALRCRFRPAHTSIHPTNGRIRNELNQISFLRARDTQRAAAAAAATEPAERMEKRHTSTRCGIKASRWQWTLCKAYTFHHANIHTFAIIRQTHTHRPKHECVFNILHKTT